MLGALSSSTPLVSSAPVAVVSSLDWSAAMAVYSVPYWPASRISTQRGRREGGREGEISREVHAQLYSAMKYIHTKIYDWYNMYTYSKCTRQSQFESHARLCMYLHAYTYIYIYIHACTLYTCTCTCTCKHRPQVCDMQILVTLVAHMMTATKQS